MTETKSGAIYILLTRSDTLLSGAISFFTGDSYTHVSLAFDPQLQSLCSFARRNAAFPLPAGLVRESLNGGYFCRHSEMPCALYVLPVSHAAYRKARRKVEKMLENRLDYRYSIKGLALCKLGIEEEREGHYFCSQWGLRPAQAALPDAAPGLCLPAGGPVYFPGKPVPALGAEPGREIRLIVGTEGT